MTNSTRVRVSSPVPGRAANPVVRWADIAGALGAILAALCCMGTPIIVAALGAVGLAWLRQDVILWPLMFFSLGVALWELARDRRRHGTSAPFVFALAGSTALVAGVVFVHGPPARLMIYGGALALVAAAWRNVLAGRAHGHEPLTTDRCDS